MKRVLLVWWLIFAGYQGVGKVPFTTFKKCLAAQEKLESSGFFATCEEQ